MSAESKIHPLLEAAIRPHSPAERTSVETAIEADIQRGRIHDVFVDCAKNIVDGRLTAEYYQRNGLIPNFVTVVDDDIIETIISRNLGRALSVEHRLRALVILRHEIAKLPTARGGKTRDKISTLLNGDFCARSVQDAITAAKEAPEVFDRLGFGLDVVDVKRIADLPAETRIAVLQDIDGGKKADVAWRDARNAIILHDVNSLASIRKKYPVIVADLPWSYNDDGPGKRGVAANHYPTMTLEELTALGSDINRIANDDAVLLLWTTSPLLPTAIKLLEQWDWAYKQELIWEKDGLGMGSILRINHESCLIAHRGHGVPVSNRGVGSCGGDKFAAPKGLHSAKPAEFYAIVETLWPDVRKIELFARIPRQGWDRWGAESAPDLT